MTQFLLSEDDRQKIVDLLKTEEKRKHNSRFRDTSKKPQDPQSIYIAIPPCTGIPAGSDDVPGYAECCICKLSLSPGQSAATIVRVLSPTGAQATELVYNVHQVPVDRDRNPYIPIKESKYGQYFCDLPLGTLLATSAVVPTIPPCSGHCNWTWDLAGNKWDLDSENCAEATTTSTSTTTTQAGDTTTADPCACTTTTVDPNTEPCNCTYPTFCGIEDGDTTITFCAKGEVLSPSDLACTTTSTTDTTTTCDCNTTTTGVPGDCNENLADCDKVCVYKWFLGHWQLIHSDCDPNCSPLHNQYCCGCIYPGGDCNGGPANVGVDCEEVTVCCRQCGQTLPTTTPDPCIGLCAFIWSESAGTWYKYDPDEEFGSQTCPLAHPSELCFCVYPSEDGDVDCAYIETPCQQRTTTLDPCNHCYTTTSTSTTTTSTSTTTTLVPCTEDVCAWSCTDQHNGQYIRLQGCREPCVCDSIDLTGLPCGASIGYGIYAEFPCVGSTTTTQCGGSCSYRWDTSLEIWVLEADDCTTGCGCDYPAISGTSDTQIVVISCLEIPPTTTTEAATSTTEEAIPETTTTTTTTQEPCEDRECQWICRLIGSSYIWIRRTSCRIVSTDNCFCAEAAGDCDEANVGAIEYQTCGTTAAP